MVMHVIRKTLFFVFVFISYTAFSQRETVTAVVPDLLQKSDPSVIQIGNYWGERINACIERRVKGQDVSHLIEPFYNKTETRRWQSEFWGKWMLGAVLSYRYTKDPVLLDSITYGVKGLLDSQLPNGYIGNYSEESQLQQWDVWGRKYTLLGLLAYYDLTGDKKILKACCKAADHLMSQVGPGKVDIVTTGNYFGMASSSILEPVIYLYRRTGEKRYLDFAHYIVAQWETEKGPRLISKAEQGIPVGDRFPHPSTIGQNWFGTHNGEKAYEMMSCYEGLLELYKLTNEPRYLSAVEKTVQSIIDTEINVAGSGSAFECWFHGKELQTRPTYHTMETCVTMTWMKLCQTLLSLTGNPLYADQIETTAYNALLASMKDDASQIAKYSPLEGQRHPGEEQCGMHINCCNANGPRGFALLPEFAVMKGTGKLFVNFYTDFTTEIPLDKKRKIRLKQETGYPAGDQIKISVDTDKPEKLTIGLRIPSWSKENAIWVNGEKQAGITAGDYYEIDRMWNTGDMITLSLDVRGRVVKSNNFAAIMKGPVVLARDIRLGKGFVDETARMVEKEGYIELQPVENKPGNVWMAFTAPLILGTDLEGDARNPEKVPFCDFASAGNTWDRDIRYRVWIPETLNAMHTIYKPYNE